MKIGIVSDTHNLLRPEVLGHLQGCDAILHAGDISGQRVLDRLQAIAPVYAVRGNNEQGETEKLPVFLDFELGGLHIYMTHKKKDLPADLTPYDLAVCGHSHQYASIWLEHEKKRTLLFNPGSCGPRRFLQPITMAILTVDADGWIVRQINIPHTPRENAPKIGPDIRSQIELVMRETEKGRGPKEIARRNGMEEALAEQIVRLYVTHPGVTADGIMTKMGL